MTQKLEALEEDEVRGGWGREWEPRRILIPQGTPQAETETHKVAATGAVPATVTVTGTGAVTAAMTLTETVTEGKGREASRPAGPQTQGRRVKEREGQTHWVRGSQNAQWSLPALDPSLAGRVHLEQVPLL